VKNDGTALEKEKQSENADVQLQLVILCQYRPSCIQTARLHARYASWRISLSLFIPEQQTHTYHFKPDTHRVL